MLRAVSSLLCIKSWIACDACHQLNLRDSSRTTCWGRDCVITRTLYRSRSKRHFASYLTRNIDFLATKIKVSAGSKKVDEKITRRIAMAHHGQVGVAFVFTIHFNRSSARVTAPRHVMGRRRFDWTGKEWIMSVHASQLDSDDITMKTAVGSRAMWRRIEFIKSKRSRLHDALLCNRLFAPHTFSLSPVRVRSLFDCHK